MRKFAICLTGAAAIGLGVPAVHALEIDPHVPPQVDIGGRALVTTDFERSRDEHGWDNSETVGFGDSTLLFGFSKNLFDDEHYAFADFGLKLVEDDSDFDDDIFPHQIFAGIGGRSFEAGIGRTTLPNTLVTFPTLREDDLMAFTHVPNAFSDADHAEVYELYGNQVSGAYYFGNPRFSVNAAAVARTETHESEDHQVERKTFTDFNSGNLGVAYSVPREIQFTRGLRFAGLSVDSQNINGEEDDWIHSVIGGVTAVVNNDPEGPLVADFQAIHNIGTDAVDDLGAGAMSRARAESTQAAAALRYRHMPYLQTRWQAALSVAYKDYGEFEDANSYAVAPTFNYHLGSGVSLLAQYMYINREEGIAEASESAREDHRVQLGISFDFDYTLNPTVHSRESILFMEHDMLQIGPARGGH